MNHVMLLLFLNKKPSLENTSVYISVDLLLNVSLYKSKEARTMKNNISQTHNCRCNNNISPLYNINSKKWSRKSVDKLSGETIDYKILSALNQ